ncbi:hypothetical protein D8B26_001018 [Coccidioides posadasii str. Silveira]|uniref:Uncharacterized protein n=3 Tax=Coccidioides posadasii TaxID=199306 RepID=E9CU83_COCPS|nr:hypothetical protein CPC735_039710 [Coccidioides posadasii C735 delta SOWgp]EER28707.1 hypothetical protein CPC735_039710 [Coccidioides posadasii C735 delta SOWgp]EFW22272.1 conserved hypothetical protein [Coccidioides posadasii str. Silveira]KMM64184.1 hypothetical protein CPAG_00536 [Coccidioides posadasii RMSCC 3488]QVM06306.1 hypothetical protein D8B26_001018 [Coccidioides posadasii str. Silveira]|eukprot:XP_003070852.1 hypothetical protein CPC735_039710 [Coccidioides posadasii C735 delta SOWgp]
MSKEYMPGMLSHSPSPEKHKVPVVVGLMEARTSKKRTRDDDAGGENHNRNLFMSDISNSHFVNPPTCRGYSIEQPAQSMVTVISPPTTTRLFHGSRINLDIRPRLRPAVCKRKRTGEHRVPEHLPQTPYNCMSDPGSKCTLSHPSSPHRPESVQQQRQNADRPPPTAAPILTPCHICYRRPTMHFQLDAYADCELCRKRTCYICLRECDGPDCRTGVMDTSSGSCERSSSGRKMCSWCAVEGVTDSGVDAVWCVDCVQRGEARCQDDAWMGG